MDDDSAIFRYELVEAAGDRVLPRWVLMSLSEIGSFDVLVQGRKLAKGYQNRSRWKKGPSDVETSDVKGINSPSRSIFRRQELAIPPPADP